MAKEQPIVEVEIAGHRITVDAEDAKRLRRDKRRWQAMSGESNTGANSLTVRFVVNLSNEPGRPAWQLLQGYLLNQPLDQYVEQIVIGNNYSKSNLRVYRSR